MRQNPLNHLQPGISGNVKYLFLENLAAQGETFECSPFFYVEARVDFNDVRTGFRTIVSLSKALKLYSISSDLSLVDDLAQDVDPKRVKSSMPESTRLASLPDFVNASYVSQMETQFIQHLLNSFKASVFRNFELDIYSSAGESLKEFTSRCMDLLEGARRRDLDNLREVVNRKLGQIEQKFLIGGTSENFELAKAASTGRDIFSDYLEQIAELFLHPRPFSNSETGRHRHPRSELELEERLLLLELETRRAIAELWASYEARAQSVDEYILHPNLRDIHLVRSGILWMPFKVA